MQLRKEPEAKDVWNRLYQLVTDVIHSDPNGGRPTADELARRLESLRPECERVLNVWHFRFPNLSHLDTELFVRLMNSVLSAAITVANSVRSDGSKQDVAALQGCLGEIRDGVQTVLYHPMVSILRHSADVLDDGLPAQKRTTAASEINEEIRNLREWVKELERKENRYNCFLPGIRGSEVEAVRQKCTSLMSQWQQAHPGQPFKASDEESTAVLDLISVMQKSADGYVTALPYSADCIRQLAAWFAFESICGDIQRSLELENREGGDDRGKQGKNEQE
jgi:hypothetical protein